jgi:hypothetical protein
MASGVLRVCSQKPQNQLQEPWEEEMCWGPIGAEIVGFQNPISMLHAIRVLLQQGLEAGMVAEGGGVGRT